MGAVAAGGDAGWAAGGSAERVAGELGSARAISTGLAGVRGERLAGGRALPVWLAGGCAAAEKSSRAVRVFWGAAWPKIRQAVQQESAKPRVVGIVGWPVRVDRPPLVITI